MIVEMFKGVDPQLATFLLAMMPIGEVRLSIPTALLGYHMDISTTVLLSLAGNIFAGLLVLAVIEPIIKYLIKHWEWLNRLWSKYIYRLETKNKAAFDKYGSLILILFVAIPLPMTGIYSGAVAASIFQIPFWRAAGLLSFGTSIATIIVVGVTVGFDKLF